MTGTTTTEVSEGLLAWLAGTRRSAQTVVAVVWARDVCVLRVCGVRAAHEQDGVVCVWRAVCRCLWRESSDSVVVAAE